MRSAFSLVVKGKEKTWSVRVLATEQEAKAMRDDGVDLWRVLGSVPDWCPSWAVTPCLKVQALWQFLRLW